MEQKTGFFRRIFDAAVKSRSARARVEAQIYFELYERADRD